MEIVKPFVKWAGGKNSLIPQLTKYYPFELKTRDLVVDNFLIRIFCAIVNDGQIIHFILEIIKTFIVDVHSHINTTLSCNQYRGYCWH